MAGLLGDLGSQMEVEKMRDYSQGAFEALSWARSLFDQINTRCQGCQKSLEQIDLMLSKIQRGAAVDFDLKIDSH